MTNNCHSNMLKFAKSYIYYEFTTSPNMKSNVVKFVRKHVGTSRFYFPPLMGRQGQKIPLRCPKGMAKSQQRRRRRGGRRRRRRSRRGPTAMVRRRRYL